LCQIWNNLHITPAHEDKKLTQKEIGKKIGWSESQLSRYFKILEILPQVLNLCKFHQNGRGNKELPSGNFDFTEGWFRTSGLYRFFYKYFLYYLI